MTPENICAPVKGCRICGSSELLPVIDLGPQYIGSHFVKDQVPYFLAEPYPLEVVRCAGEGSCGLVQLRHTVSPSVLYLDYGYLSGINESMRAHLRDIVLKAQQVAELKPGDTVVDIGCNDGTLLCAYQTADIDRLGFDPAENVAAIARNKGLDVIADYFSAEGYKRARPNVKAKVVTSIAMFYDLEDPSVFVRDVAGILRDDGVWILELAYLPFVLEKSSFDTICHEHVGYYTLRQIEWMLRKEDLKVRKLEFNDVNGGSFRLFIEKRAFGCASDDDWRSVENAREREKELRLDTDLPYSRFKGCVFTVREELRSLLTKLKGSGVSIYVYGASTKGNTLLQFCGIDKTIITKAADRNPDKWGGRTPGTDIPIVSEEEARAEQPGCFLVLPWHFLQTFIVREAAFLARGGKFIVPLPEVRVIGREDIVLARETSRGS